MAASKKEASKNVVDRETAKNEFENWMYVTRRIKTRLIDDKNPETIESIENCIENIVDGTFKINPEDGSIIHKLTFPIGEDVGSSSPIEELTYAPRMYANAFTKNRKYRNPDEHTKMNVMIASLSKTMVSMIEKMDQSDLATAGDLMYFYFLG